MNELDYDAPPFVVPDIFRDGENPFVLILSDALKTPEEELAGALFSAVNNPETEEKPFPMRGFIGHATTSGTV